MNQAYSPSHFASHRGLGASAQMVAMSPAVFNAIDGLITLWPLSDGSFNAPVVIPLITSYLTNTAGVPATYLTDILNAYMTLYGDAQTVGVPTAQILGDWSEYLNAQIFSDVDPTTLDPTALATSFAQYLETQYGATDLFVPANDFVTLYNFWNAALSEANTPSLGPTKKMPASKAAAPNALSDHAANALQVALKTGNSNYLPPGMMSSQIGGSDYSSNGSGDGTNGSGGSDYSTSDATAATAAATSNTTAWVVGGLSVAAAGGLLWYFMRAAPAAAMMEPTRANPLRRRRAKRRGSRR